MHDNNQDYYIRFNSHVFCGFLDHYVKIILVIISCQHGPVRSTHVGRGWQEFEIEISRN